MVLGSFFTFFNLKDIHLEIPLEKNITNERQIYCPFTEKGKRPLGSNQRAVKEFPSRSM